MLISGGDGRERIFRAPTVLPDAVGPSQDPHTMMVPGPTPVPTVTVHSALAGNVAVCALRVTVALVPPEF